MSKTFEDLVLESYLARGAVDDLVNAKRELDAHDALPVHLRGPHHVQIRERLKNEYRKARQYHMHTTQL